MSDRHRAYCWTLNNYAPEEVEKIKKCDIGYITYLIFGKEVGEKGTPHLQGYLELSKALGVKRINKDIFDNRAHLEPRKGTQQQAIKYCKKDKDIFEFGEPKIQGERQDINEVKKMLLEGKPIREIVAQATSYQSIRMAEKFIQYLEPSRNWNPKIIYVWGPSGYGKSHFARMLAPKAYTAGENYKFWQRYDANEDVILDNWTSEWAPPVYMLRLLDKWPFTVETKGGSREMLAKRFIITTVIDPRFALSGCKEQDEFQRRLADYGAIININQHWTEQDPDFDGDIVVPLSKMEVREGIQKEIDNLTKL